MENTEVQSAVEHKIYMIRGQRVMCDFDLAGIYNVSTKRLNEQVKRNIARFPSDFAFQLTLDEFKALMSQIATSKLSRGGRTKLPYVFTEHGVVMLSSVLRSPRAIQMNIFIVRAFIKMRELLNLNKELALKIDEIERKQKEQGDQISSVYSVVKQLIEQPVIPKKKIGFKE